MLKVGQAAVALSLSILSIPAGFLALSSAAVCVSSAHPALSPVVPQTSLCLNSLVSRVPAARRDAGMMLQSRVEGCFAAPSPSLPPPSPPHFPLLLLQPPPPHLPITSHLQTLSVSPVRLHFSSSYKTLSSPLQPTSLPRPFLSCLCLCVCAVVSRCALASYPVYFLQCDATVAVSYTHLTLPTRSTV